MVVEGSADRTDWLSAIPFFGVHLAPLAAFFVVVTWQDWVLCAVLYVSRMFFITAGYHRYFSHRSYRMGRVAQFLMAFGGTTAVQKGPLWWASHHRLHHRYTDLDDDVHSPRDGFWWSHVGWILSTKYKDTDLTAIKDFAAYPELRLLERASWIGPWMLAIGCLLIGGWGGLVIGFFLSTVLLWHGTFLVNSAGPPGGSAPLRHAGHQPQLRPHRRSSPAVRAGTTTTTTCRPRPARASPGGSSTPPGTGCGRWPPCACPRSQGPAGPAAGPGPGSRRSLRHRHVPLLLGAGGQGHRRAHRRPERPAVGPVSGGSLRMPTDAVRARRRARPGPGEPLSHLSGLISRALEIGRPAGRLHPPDPEGSQGGLGPSPGPTDPLPE